MIRRLYWYLRGRFFPPAPPPTVIVASVAHRSGWSIRVTQLAGTYSASVIAPNGVPVHQRHFYRDFDQTVDSACEFLARHERLPLVAAVLRINAKAQRPGDLN